MYCSKNRLQTSDQKRHKVLDTLVAYPFVSWRYRYMYKKMVSTLEFRPHHPELFQFFHHVESFCNNVACCLSQRSTMRQSGGI